MRAMGDDLLPKEPRRHQAGLALGSSTGGKEGDPATCDLMPGQQRHCLPSRGSAEPLQRLAVPWSKSGPSSGAGNILRFFFIMHTEGLAVANF